MKKLFMMMATTAIVLAGCSKDEMDHIPNGQKEIKFSNLNDKVNTRAANDNGYNYQVYAVWNGGTTWLINDDVDGTTNVPSGGPYYWPTEAGSTVDFYAWAPSLVTATANYPDLSIDYTVGNAEEDFTIAKPKTGLSSGVVAFEFAHMLSKISVTASLSQDLLDAGYSLDATTLATGLSANLSVNTVGGTINPKDADPVWTAPISNQATYTNTSFLIMPQTSTGCTVQIMNGIQIMKDDVHQIYIGGLSEYTIKAGDIAGDVFEKGKHYMLNLTIDDSSHGNGPDPENPDPIFNIITFTSDVADWDTPAGIDTPLGQP